VEKFSHPAIDVWAAIFPKKFSPPFPQTLDWRWIRPLVRPDVVPPVPAAAPSIAHASAKTQT